MSASHQILAVRPITFGPGSHFFGFHDLCPFDPTDRWALGLKVKFLDRPPAAEDRAEIVLVDGIDGSARVIGTTTAWNFPQGARQQWRPGRPGEIVFNRWDEGRLSGVVCAMDGHELGRIAGGIYAFSPDGREAYSLDFRRLHALGGYGYAGRDPGKAFAPCPDDDGLWRIGEGESEASLLLSIRQVAAVLGLPGGSSAPPQYLTHILPSPAGRRLCFLHRYLMPDGGINTTVCVCARDGSGLKVLASGFYSHFDWLDESTLIFWGRGVNRVHALRNTQSHLLGKLLRAARPVYRAAKRIFGNRLIINESYYAIDVENAEKRPFFSGQLREDGHPTFLSGDRRWLVTDTYPDLEGYRTLFLVDCRDRVVHDLGRLGTPVLALRDSVEDYLTASGVGAGVLAKTGAWNYFRSRSGYSCDFHPRFNRRGSQVCLDSLHTGERQIYTADVSGLTSR
jgi:hypothetical protein